MPVSKKWLDYPSIKRIRGYLVAKNGGYEYLSIKSLLTSFVEPVYYFCKSQGYDDPEAFLKDIKDDKVDVIEAIQNFRLWLIEKGRAPSSIRRYNNGIRRWLEINRVKIDWNEVNYTMPLPKKRSVVEDRMPTREELRRILNAADLKMKAIIELTASTGLRAGSLIGLRIEDLDFDMDPRIVLVRIRPEYSKTKIGYYTLANDEARDTLIQYIEAYDIKDGWLFPARSGSGHMTYNSLQLRWSRLLKKTGLDMKSKGIYVLHFHTLRKWFRTRLEGYLTRSQIEYLMGHLRKEYLDGAYFRPPNDELIASYKAAMHRLYILWSEEPKIEDLRKKTLLDMARLLGFREKTIRKIENMLEKRSIDDVLKELRRMRRL